MTTDFIDESRRIGSWIDMDGGVNFRVWAPESKKVELSLMSSSGSSRRIQMTAGDRGYFDVKVEGAKVGDNYKFRLDGKSEYPDPASRFQPEGPHGPSQIVEREFEWSDHEWLGVERDELVIYELHVGTFSEAGTFAGVAEKIEHFKQLGINAIEIMPVAQFAGRRNWGYDGVGLFAPQNSYGGNEKSPAALKSLVDRCHQAGIAVILDVVYNHLGPEGNYLSSFGPYFQSKYHTPWGDALNYDGEWSDEVRRYFLENARQWLEEYHFDGLRLDAVHAIFDTSATPFLEDLGRMKSQLEVRTGRKLHLIAESDANDSRLLHPPEEGGLGMDAHWADDLHHVIHGLLTGERHGYYRDYGDVEQIQRAYEDGVVFHGEYSEFRHRRHGRSYEGISKARLVVCSQNHDQIGNRMNGERLIQLAGPEKAKLAAACVFLSPNMPLMFMGEELGEDAPFLYFIDHTDKELVEAVRKGRREEFSSFKWQGEPPDPASPKTFEESRVQWQKHEGEPRAQAFFAYYQRLIELSKWIRKEKVFEGDRIRTRLLAEGRVLEIIGSTDREQVGVYLSFSSDVEEVLPEWSQAPLDLTLDSSENDLFSTPKEIKANEAFSLKPYSAVVLLEKQTT